MINVPLGTVTSLPSTVSVTRSDATTAAPPRVRSNPRPRPHAASPLRPVLGGEDRRRAAAWRPRLQRGTVDDPAGEVLDEHTNRRPERRFVVAGTLHLPRHAEHLRPARSVGPDPRVPLVAALDDVRDVAE